MPWEKNLDASPLTDRTANEAAKDLSQNIWGSMMHEHGTSQAEDKGNESSGDTGRGAGHNHHADTLDMGSAQDMQALYGHREHSHKQTDTSFDAALTNSQAVSTDSQLAPTQTEAESTATTAPTDASTQPTTNYSLIPTANTQQIAGGSGVTAGQQYDVTPMTMTQMQGQMEGVNTHFGWYDEIPYASGVSQTIQDLQNTGIKNLRVGIPDNNPTLTSQYQTLSNDGFSGLAVMDQSVSASQAVSDIISSNAQDGNFIEAVEGPNETNGSDASYATDGGAAGVATYVDQFAQAAKDQGLNIPILSPSLDTVNSAVLPQDAQALADGGVSAISSGVSVHAYDLSGNPEDGMLQSNTSAAAGAFAGQPSVVTEEGWTQTGTPGYTQDATVQAKYDARALLTNAAAGDPTYLYQATNLNANDDGTWGLFNVDGSTTAAGTTISNMNKILDNGSTSPDSSTAAQNISYNITGDTSNVNQLALQNGNTTDLVLWAGTQSDDTTTQQQVQINLSGQPQNATVYDPTNGTDAVSSSQDTNAFGVTVEDQPIIIQLQNAT